jgi:hypothetical protein
MATHKIGQDDQKPEKVTIQDDAQDYVEEDPFIEEEAIEDISDSKESMRAKLHWGDTVFAAKRVSNAGSADALLEYMKTCISTDEFRSYDVEVYMDVITSQSGVRGAGQLVADVVYLQLEKDGMSIIGSIMVVDPDMTLPSYRVPMTNSYYWRDDYNLTQGIKDLDSGNLRGVLASAASANVGVNYASDAHKDHLYIGENIPITSEITLDKDGKISHPTANISMMVTMLIQTLSLKLAVDVTGDIEDMTMHDIRDKADIITLGVTEHTDGPLRTPDGTMFKPDVTFRLGMRNSESNQERQYGNRYVDPHSSSNNEMLCKAYMSTEIIRQEGISLDGGIQLGNANPAETNAWVPALIVDNMSFPAAPSHSVLLFAAATIAGFLTPEMVMSLYNTDIRYLNVISNLLNTKVSEPIAKSVMNKAFTQVFKNLFDSKYYLGVRIRPGTSLYSMLKDYLAEANGDKGYNPLRPAVQKMVPRELLKWTKYITTDFIDIHPTGWYTDKTGKSMPLSPIGITDVIAHDPRDADLHREWLRACSDNMSEEERLASKMQIISVITHNTAQFEGREYTVYFRSQLLAALLESIKTSEFILEPEDTVPSMYRSLSWDSHGAHHSGMSYDYALSSRGRRPHY